MSQSLMAMSADLVRALIRAQQVPADDCNALLAEIHGTLLELHEMETSGTDVSSMTQASTTTAKDWKASIRKHSIECLECGNTFRLLSARHLRLHDLTPQAYRSKYGIPSTQPLSSRQATARRRELAQAIRPWEKAASKRTAKKSRRGRSARQPAKA